MTDPEIIIIGAGPAGLAAAASLAKAGRTVLVLERELRAGGVPIHCHHSPFGMREFGWPMSGAAYARRLIARAEAAGAEIRLGTTVTRLAAGPQVTIASDAGPQTVHPRLVLLAMGARESSRAQRLIGGEKPGGILPTGALQAMLTAGLPPPFRRPVILGTELVAFSALLTCRQMGIRPVAMVEPTSRPISRWPSALLPAVLGIALLRMTGIRAVHGLHAVESVEIEGPQGRRRIEADGLLLTGGFRPEAALLPGSPVARDPGSRGVEIDEYGRASDPTFFAAGNVLRGVETAGHCWAEGRAVAGAMLRALAGTLPAATSQRLAPLPAGIAWALPQRRAGGSDPALPLLRVSMAVRQSGALTLRSGGADQALRAGPLRPGRSMRLPLPSTAQAELRLEQG